MSSTRHNFCLTKGFTLSNTHKHEKDIKQLTVRCFSIQNSDCAALVVKGTGHYFSKFPFCIYKMGPNKIYPTGFICGIHKNHFHQNHTTQCLACNNYFKIRCYYYYRPKYVLRHFELLEKKQNQHQTFLWCIKFLLTIYSSKDI